MSMILHALWLPPGFCSTGLGLYLWAESTHARRSRTPAYQHPQAVSALSLEQHLYQFRVYRSTRPNPPTLTLALPSNARGPLTSNQSPPPPTRSKREPAKPVLTPWRVETYPLAPDQALNFLLQLPGESTYLTLGPSLKFWRQAAWLTAFTLDRGLFVPSADETGRGFWKVWLEVDAELKARAAQLAEVMPPSARALTKPLPAADELLHDFINGVGSAFIAQSSMPNRSPFYDPYTYNRRPRAPHPADKWWADLFPRKNYYFNDAVAPATRRNFGEKVRAWFAPTQTYLGSPYQVVFRLEPPILVETEDPALADWQLSFHLRPKAETATLWSAGEVWENPPQPETPDVLQAGLQLAAAIFPPLLEAAEDLRTGVSLSLPAAVEFLETYAHDLDAAGFGVLVPSWWKSQARKLKAKVQLGKRDEGFGLLGLDALVDFNWQIALGDQQLTTDEFMQLAQSKTGLVQVRGEWMQLNPEEVQAAVKLMQRHRKNDGKLPLREALGLTLAGTTTWEGLEVETERVDGWLDEVTGRLTGRQPLKSVPQPEGFVGQLRPYQCNGLSWLTFMREWGFGACLADDMGLGKTVQVLALLQSDLNAAQLTQPVLLVCPTTVVNNWVREAERFAPHLRCYAHHGPARFKNQAFVAAAREHHLVITSYALLPRDLEILKSIDWGGIVLDEAHNIKNPTTKQAQTARSLTAKYRLALTGTPVENRLQDLWSIMHFLNPGYLGSAESFQHNFVGAIERGQDPRVATRLRALTGPFLLRRLKTDQSIIHDLPPKNEMKEYCGLTKEQAALYRAVVQESLRQIAAADGIQRRGIILATLTKLKQVCNHPRHLLGDRSALKNRSGKLNRLTEMLEQALAEEDRCLIFTQYAEMGRLLREYLTETFGETLYLDGSTPAMKRAELITRFQAGGLPLFVLSLKAGGAGINLTHANRVFHYDRWWNPAVENQATDRAFRIGQTQTVQVHKFICRGTLEERVDELITRKLALADQIVGSGEAWLTELSTDELRDLLLLRREAIDD